jgi:uncharacterized membrane protein YfcA
MFKFNPFYFIGFVLLLITEILIALYAHDEFVRPLLGDFLVVIMLYCLVKSIIKKQETEIALFVLIFAYLVELGQYYQLVKLIGLDDYPLANIVIGNFFSWVDIVMYTLGIILVLSFEYVRLKDLEK